MAVNRALTPVPYVGRPFRVAGVFRLVLLLLALAAAARADVILTAAGLNTTLKTLETLKKQIASGAGAERLDALYQLGLESDGLATLINDEIAAHGMQEKALIDLALRRLKELGIGVAYNRDKRQFFYDGDAFKEYLKAAPGGTRAAGAEFKLIEHQFYTSKPDDPARLVAAADRKQRFLRRYPRFESSSQVSLMLSIDYQDLYRLYGRAKNAQKRAQYAALARQQLQLTAQKYPDSEEADVAKGLLKRLETEIAQRDGKSP